MNRLLRKLWADDTGAMLAVEWVFMGTILVLGVIPGMVAIRNGMTLAMLRGACQLNGSSCACSSAPVSTPAESPAIVNQEACD